ncbi:MAG: serine/threonine protein kinase [Deltaproteobacteria bacterium]|nr:serine/threonine protein kinase [Deltaproteobacteria bacterium]
MSELRTLGRYRILRRLGRGGMANVYLAELSGDHGFAKTVAIKTIHPHRAGEARFVTMFLEEMRVASRLSHPNVCAVLDFGMEGETPYLVMEHLDGFPLSAVVAHDSVGIPRDIAARVVADAARGLHAAHELPGRDGKPGGIVHRDVSPQNVMLLRTGVAKVLDFGIAKAADPSGAITSSHPKGKLRYMAPEQLAGAPVDRRADIWSLGVVLWEATLGRRLFAEGPTGGASASVLSQGIERP